jgi:hypothetical protein
LDKRSQSVQSDDISRRSFRRLELLERFELFERRFFMPSDETRRVLKVFGVAVTTYEDAVEAGGPAEEIKKAEAEIDASLTEVTVLIERLRAKRTSGSPQRP